MIDFSQFEEGETVSFHHGEYDPPKFRLGKIYEANDLGPHLKNKVYTIESGASKHYFYENSKDCEGEIRKLTEAEKIMLGVF